MALKPDRCQYQIFNAEYISCFEQDIRHVTQRYDVGHLSAHGLRIRGMACAVLNFSWRGFPVEVFGQPIAIRLEHGYRHLLIESCSFGEHVLGNGSWLCGVRL